jgi:hypothetical protein
MTDAGNLRSKRGLTMDVAAELGDLLYDLTHDKKTRAKIGRIIREAQPDSNHAKAFKDVELDERFDAFEKAQEDKALEEARKSALARMETQRASLLSGGDDGNGRKYSEDDLKKIEELMQKRGIIDYEDGAVLYSAANPQAGPLEDEPVTPGTTWEFPEFAKFKDDPIKASREVAFQAIRELRTRKGLR